MGLLNVVGNGGAGQVIWAITNVCNAKCNFCSYTTGKGGKSAYVDFSTAQKALAVLDERNWKILSFTGGEPLLNPDVYKIITQATKMGFITRTGTNGKVLSIEVIKKLKNTGLRNFWISIDSEIEERHNANRGIPDLLAHIKKMIPLLKNEGIRVNAAVPVNKLIGNYSRFFEFLTEIGLDTVAFCYPMTCMEASYGGAAPSELVFFTPAELVQVLEEIKRLKEEKYAQVRVINPRTGLSEMIRQNEARPSQFKCLGGYKFFYLDWHLTLYRCAYLAENYGHLFELDPQKTFVPQNCDQCMWQCFRDPSIYYYLLESLGKFKDSLLKGNVKDVLYFFKDEKNKACFQDWLSLVRNRFYA